MQLLDLQESIMECLLLYVKQEDILMAILNLEYTDMKYINFCYRIKAETLKIIADTFETKRSVVSWMRVARCDIIFNDPPKYTMAGLVPADLYFAVNNRC